eukprot:4495095-Amphidinium_carterae.1
MAGLLPVNHQHAYTDEKLTPCASVCVEAPVSGSEEPDNTMDVISTRQSITSQGHAQIGYNAEQDGLQLEEPRLNTWPPHVLRTSLNKGGSCSSTEYQRKIRTARNTSPPFPRK